MGYYYSGLLNPISTIPIHYTDISSNQKRLFRIRAKKASSILAVSSSSSSLHTLISLQPYIQSEWRSVLLGWSSSILSVYSISRLVPELSRFSPTMADLHKSPLFGKYGVSSLLLLLLRIVANYYQQAFLWDAALRSAYRLRLHVFDSVLQKDLVFYEGGDGVLAAGDISHQITAEASDVADTIYHLLNNGQFSERVHMEVQMVAIVPSTLHLLAMGSKMVVISPLLSSLSVLVTPCMAFLIAHLGEKLRQISREAQLSSSNLSAYLNEVLSSIFLVKASGLELCENARFQQIVHADLCVHLRKKKLRTIIPQISRIACFGLLSALFLCYLKVSNFSINSHDIISFITSFALLVEPVRGAEKAYSEWRQVEPAVERLIDFTRYKSQVVEKPDAFALESVAGDLMLCDVSFGYKKDLPLVLDRLNLHVRPGETVALVGPSGGGKTTLVKLLLRLYDPIHGAIFVDKHDIRNMKVESLRRHMSLVSQDVIMFSGSVAENIGHRDRMGCIDMERVEYAAQMANADGFIGSLPKGYNTNIGPRGSLLSGGQKQRVAIARAIYQNSSVLIMDEATSALDSKSESAVRRAVQRVTENRTVVVIGHRLETVLMADRILLLSGGKLKELDRPTLLDASPSSIGLVI